MIRPVTSDARIIELDVSDAPEAYFVCTLDAESEFIDLVADFSDSDNAHAFAEELARAHNLPLKIRHVPAPLGD